MTEIEKILNAKASKEGDISDAISLALSHTIIANVNDPLLL